MTKTSKIIIGVIIAIIIIVGIWYGLTREQEEEEVIKIGFIGPLSGFGAAWGIEQKNAIDIAVEEINNSGGIRGQKIEIIYEDGKCDGKEAATAAQKLINLDKVKILIPVCSAETLAVAPIAEENKVLVMAVWPTNPAVSEAGDYIFRNSYSDEDTARVMAETIEKKYSKVGIITELTDYPVGLRDAFKKYFKGEIIEEVYQPNSKDVRTQVLKLISQSTEAIVVNPNSPATGLAVLQQLNELKFEGGLYGNFFGSGSEVINAEEAQGMIFFADPVVEDSLIKARLFEKYQNEYNKKPDFEFAVAATYDAIYILKQAIEQVGVNPDKIRDYLYDLKDFQGALGVYGFNEKGDMIGVFPSVKQIINNEIIRYEE